MAVTRPSGTLFRKYAASLAGLVSVALLVSGVVAVVFGYRDTRALVEQLQLEKARGAAQRIEQFAGALVRELRSELPLRAVPGDLQVLRFDLHRLLRQNPALVEVAWIDDAGIEQLRVSRLARDVVSSAADKAAHPGFIAALAGEAHFSRIYLRHGSEPHLTLAVADARRAQGVLISEVNLTFVSDVVAAVAHEAIGRALIVDERGRLISHPDVGLVLRGTDLSAHEAVRTALGGGTGVWLAATSAEGRDGRHMVAHAPVALLGWHLFFEQPLEVAFAPLRGSLARAAALLILGIAAAALFGLALARRMVRPIDTLAQGARRLGEGRLDERVDIRTGDEIEALAMTFNQMAERVQESTAGLERKVDERTRQLAQANQAKSRFLAAASHDLRQPVHALGLYIAQLRDAQTPAARDRLLGKVEASSAAVSELIEALLDISKLDAGAVMPQPVAFAAQDLLNRLEDGFALAARAKGLRLRVRPSRLRVATDPMLLERIVVNLTANALRYTREGGILISCRPQSGFARFEVWDTGVGIPAAQQAKVFEEFYQAESVADAGEDAKGLGLGLAIVDRLATLLALQLTLRSVPGQGSLFAITVPLAPLTVADGTPDTLAPVLRVDGAVALVVDGDTDAREAVAGLLTLWGWRVVTTPGADEALSALATLAPSLGFVLSDHHLPGGSSGLQLIESVRKACGRNVPALVVSADVAQPVRELVERAGLHLLHKPLQPARLRALLHHLLGAERADRTA